MTNQLINIRTDKFSKKEIKVIEEALKEWNYEWIVEIVYVGEGKDENLDVSFTLEQENLGEFLWLIFGCGNEFVYKG
jgi:hypothetical protein